MIKLTKSQRNDLIATGRAVYRKHDGRCDVLDIADAVAGAMFENEVELGLTAFEAIEISDYAYGVAQFIMPRETL